MDNQAWTILLLAWLGSPCPILPCGECKSSSAAPGQGGWIAQSFSREEVYLADNAEVGDELIFFDARPLHFGDRNDGTACKGCLTSNKRQLNELRQVSRGVTFCKLDSAGRFNIHGNPADSARNLVQQM